VSGRKAHGVVMIERRSDIRQRPPAGMCVVFVRGAP
jgi:hypothetical protein